MADTANMGLARPASGSAAWNGPLNDNFATVDLHDHSTGKGVPVPTSGLNINANLPFGSNRATGLRAMVFSGATSESSVQDYSVYTSGGNLYYKPSGAAAVQITSGSALNGVASTKGFGTGYDNTTVTVSYDSSEVHYIFKSALPDDTNLTNLANIVGKQLRAYGTTAGVIIDSTSASSNFRMGTAASGGNLIWSAGTSDYAGAFTEANANIMEMSPAGNVGIGTAGTGTSDRFTVRHISSTTSAIQTVSKFTSASTGTVSGAFGGRLRLAMELSTGTETETNDIEWRRDSDARTHFRFRAYEASALAECLRLGALNSPVEINMTGAEAIKIPANTNIVVASDSTCNIGTATEKFLNINADNVVAGDLTSGLVTPSTALDLATIHGFKHLVAWGKFDGAGATVTSVHYNIAGIVRNSAGNYTITLDVGCNQADAVQVTLRSAVGFVYADFASDTTITVNCYDQDGTTAADKQFSLAVLGRPAGTP